MPPVVAAIAIIGAHIVAAVTSVLAAIGSIAAGHLTLAAFVTIGKAILVIASIVSAFSALGKKSSKINQGQELALKLDPTMPRQVGVGRTASGGSQSYAFTYTDDSNIPNKYLVRVVTISDWPGTGLVKVMEGNNQLTFAGDITIGWFTCVQHLNKSNAPMMSMRVYLGSDTPTADANLISWEPNGKWTSNHKGRNTFYYAVRYTYDSNGDAFPQGEPQIYLIFDGAPQYDQRLDSTRSNPIRSGTQRLATPSTWAYSNNTAVVTQGLLRGYSTNGKLIIGAQATDNDLSDGMLLDAYNTCDQSVTKKDATSESRYRCGLMLSADRSTGDMLNDLALAMDGEVVDRGGQITLLPGATYSPVLTVTDQDIIWTLESSFQPESTLSDLYNVVTGSYVPESFNFVGTSYPIQVDGTGAYEAADGERLVMNQDFNAVFSDSQIQRTTGRRLASSRLQSVVAFVGPLWLYQLEQNDWFQLTSTRWGLSNAYFQVQGITLTQDLKVAVVAKATSTSIFGWNPASQEVYLTQAAASQSPVQVIPVPTKNDFFSQADDPTTKQFVNGVYTAGTYVVADFSQWFDTTTSRYKIRLSGAWQLVADITATLTDGTVMFDTILTGSWNFTVPANALGHVDIEIWAPGGGGGALHGGAGGGYSLYHLYAVTPGTTMFSGFIGFPGQSRDNTNLPHVAALSGGGVTVTTPTMSAGGGGSGETAAGVGGTASGGTTNTTGEAGDLGSTGTGGANLGTGGGARTGAGPDISGNNYGGGSSKSVQGVYAGIGRVRITTKT